MILSLENLERLPTIIIMIEEFRKITYHLILVNDLRIFSISLFNLIVLELKCGSTEYSLFLAWEISMTNSVLFSSLVYSNFIFLQGVIL